jgi:transposase
MTREEARALVYGNPEAAIELILQLVATVERLTARVEELERQVALLTKDSSNSSKPPSSDGPSAKPRPKPPVKSRKRKRGGQPGHKGKRRNLIPVDHVDEIIKITPQTCQHCGRHLRPDAQGRHLSDKHWRFQTIDIPEPKPVVTEYRLECVRCSCGGETWARLPKEARSGFGPRLTAFLGYLTGLHRVTRRGCQQITKTIFGIDISLGSVCKLHQEVSQSVEQSCEEVRRMLPLQQVLNADETGWKTHGDSRWLWVLVTPTLAFFHIAASRGSKVLKEILGEVFNGTLCSDMYSAYTAFHKGYRQFCWAHIIRGVKGVKHACRSPDAVKFSKWLLSETGRMFALWYAFQQGHLERKALVLQSVPIRARMHKCLQQYVQSSDYDVRKASKSLLRHWEDLFTFLEVEGVEPTNNSAERALRPAVQWRKICFGNQSEDGELLTARLLTATRTCAMQKRNSFHFLVQSVTAYRNCLPAPPLILDAC